MSDLTVYAESLIATVARAFYHDDAVCLIDVLLRDKFLRDDDMGPRLSLPAKQLRRTLQFLQDEHLVKFELVDDLSSGGSQATKFWYIDYNHAVNTIRLRIHLLQKRLEQDEMAARSSSFYLCPGYKEKRCNGRYTETEAQQVVDTNTGLFLCQECVNEYANNPNPPALETYTLQLVDNTRALKLAVDNMRRVKVQLSVKMIGSHQIRAGVFDLLQKVRVKGKGPLTSNLPSENFELGIGSKRLAGTGRTAGILAKKLAQQGVATSDSGSYLGGAMRTEEGSGPLFLKNAMGQQIQLKVEKGGGARANLLATKRRRRRKLMDAAASRAGVQVPLYWKRRGPKKRERDEKEGPGNGKKRTTTPTTLDFLKNNIGRNVDYEGMERLRQDELFQEEGGNSDSDEDDNGLVFIDDTDELLSKSEDERRTIFQAQYKVEVERQLALLQPESADSAVPPTLISDDGGADEEIDKIAWEDA